MWVWTKIPHCLNGAFKHENPLLKQKRANAIQAIHPLFVFRILIDFQLLSSYLAHPYERVCVLPVLYNLSLKLLYHWRRASVKILHLFDLFHFKIRASEHLWVTFRSCACFTRSMAWEVISQWSSCRNHILPSEYSVLARYSRQRRIFPQKEMQPADP